MTTQADAAPARRWTGRALIALLVLLGLPPFLTKGTSELPVYVLGARRMMAGENLYRPDDPKPFTYPPFFAVPFVPLALAPEPIHRPVWYLANVGALIAAFVLLRRFLRPALPAPPAPGAAPAGEGLLDRLRGGEAWFWVGVVLISGRHLLAPLENQSHDLLVLLLVVLGAVAWAGGRDGRAGCWLGLGAACKATPALFAVPFALRRSLAGLLALLVVGAAATFLPDLLFPQGGGEPYAVTWFRTMVAGLGAGGAADLEGTWVATSILNQSLAGTLTRLTTPVDPASNPRAVDACLVETGEGTRSAVILAARLAVLLLLLVATVRALRGVPEGRQAGPRFGVASCAACAMVLLSPMSSKSHFGVLLLPAAYCLADWMFRRRDRVVLALLAGMFVAGTLTVKGLWGTALGNELLARGTVTAAALLGMLAAARVAVAQARGLRPGGGGGG